MDQFPVELVEKIFKLAACEIHTAISLARVSKPVNSWIIPSLYTSIHLRSDTDTMLLQRTLHGSSAMVLAPKIKTISFGFVHVPPGFGELLSQICTNLYHVNLSHHDLSDMMKSFRTLNRVQWLTVQGQLRIVELYHPIPYLGNVTHLHFPEDSPYHFHFQDSFPSVTHFSCAYRPAATSSGYKLRPGFLKQVLAKSNPGMQVIVVHVSLEWVLQSVPGAGDDEMLAYLERLEKEDKRVVVRPYEDLEDDVEAMWNYADGVIAKKETSLQ
ncbi:hypothetical protein BT96DRAFT_393671 [Gymnopus androsaceus JB14]|uniref:F-box domain-containing protein n=1 Tax=Gymnopus androsaceus JB14 TaxID=1447944 RepID=A0A6A4GW88_9AGAR|nr:hypothetical protein BT96DRAFT_393671 [Gymnopus androsaceus JB14]